MKHSKVSEYPTTIVWELKIQGELKLEYKILQRPIFWVYFQVQKKPFYFPQRYQPEHCISQKKKSVFSSSIVTRNITDIIMDLHLCWINYNDCILKILKSQKIYNSCFLILIYRSKILSSWQCFFLPSLKV